MPRIAYIEKQFRGSSIAIIDQANDIIREYAAQGFSLTLRQLYYQFVARDLIPNQQKAYKRLGSIVNDARLAGLIDWHTIEDRTRFLRGLNTWDSPADIVEESARRFRIDRWKDQPDRIEVWIEKDALVGVIERVCNQNRVDFFSCRGYVSQSEMWNAAQRVARYCDNGQRVTVLHLGDHDPSGIDMSRDIADRLELFLDYEGHSRGDDWELKRIALTMDQVDEHGPPPNPAKLTDARASGYVSRFGYESWELDALDPSTLAGLIRDEVEQLRDEDIWDGGRTEEEEGRARIADVVEGLR